MELGQVAELNARLAASVLTSSDLGLDAPQGVLVEVVLEGSPRYGYLWGHFRVAGDLVRVLLHTDDLRTLSRAMDLPRHHWGI
jgi:hypothetical protein